LENKTNKVNQNQINERYGYVLAYDLPSENQSHIKDKDIKMQIRNVRVLAIYKLHSLGVLSTESVVLIPKSKEDKISETIEVVNEVYKKLNEDLKNKGLSGLGEPLIRVIKLSQEQMDEFKVLAERKLKEKLDEIIERVVKLINEIDEILEEERRKKILYNVRREKKELEEIQKIAKELGIETNNKFDLVFELYKSVIEKLEGGFE